MRNESELIMKCFFFWKNMAIITDLPKKLFCESLLVVYGWLDIICNRVDSSFSIYHKTRKMVNYAWIREKSEETLMEARSDTDVQIVRQIWV